MAAIKRCSRGSPFISLRKAWRQYYIEELGAATSINSKSLKISLIYHSSGNIFAPDS